MAVSFDIFSDSDSVTQAFYIVLGYHQRHYLTKYSTVLTIKAVYV